MISTSVCRLCRVSTLLLKGYISSVIGIEHEWNPRISAVLDIAVVEDDRISPYKCRSRLTTWKDAIAFIKLAQSSLQAQKKRTKVPRHGF